MQMQSSTPYRYAIYDYLILYNKLHIINRRYHEQYIEYFTYHIICISSSKTFRLQLICMQH